MFLLWTQLIICISQPRPSARAAVWRCSTRQQFSLRYILHFFTNVTRMYIYIYVYSSCTETLWSLQGKCWIHLMDMSHPYVSNSYRRGLWCRSYPLASLVRVPAGDVNCAMALSGFRLWHVIPWSSGLGGQKSTALLLSRKFADTDSICIHWRLRQLPGQLCSVLLSSRISGLNLRQSGVHRVFSQQIPRVKSPCASPMDWLLQAVERSSDGLCWPHLQTCCWTWIRNS